MLSRRRPFLLVAWGFDPGLLWFNQTPARCVAHPDFLAARQPEKAIYYAYLELPAFFRNRSRTGWFTFMVLEVSIASALRGGMSSLVSRVMYVFFPLETHLPNLKTTGVIIEHEGQVYHIHGDFVIWLGDERALREPLYDRDSGEILEARSRGVPRLYDGATT